MWALLIIAVLAILAVTAWVAFQRAEPTPREMNEEFKRRQAAGLVRDDTGKDPEAPRRASRWWSR